MTRTIHTKVKFHELRFFFAASFFLPLFSHPFFLGKTDSYRELLFSYFFALLPFFRSVFTRWRVFLLLQRHGEGTIIMKSGFTCSYEHSNRIDFFSITKCTGKARYSSKVLHRKSDSIIIAMITSED